jgi:hypothetical protein
LRNTKGTKAKLPLMNATAPPRPVVPRRCGLRGVDEAYLAAGGVKDKLEAPAAWRFRQRCRRALVENVMVPDGRANAIDRGVLPLLMTAARAREGHVKRRK